MSPGDTDVAVLDRWFAAFNTHDIDALCALADPNVEVIPLEDAITVPPGTIYQGRAGLRTLLTAGFERFPKMRLDHAPAKANGNHVTVDLEFVLDDGRSEPTVRAAVCEYRIRDGRIRWMRAFERPRVPAPRGHASRSAALSPREREILSLLAGGKTVAEIAVDLVLSPLTVRTHVRNAKDKLHARTTPHAVAIALDDHALDV